MTTKDPTKTPGNLWPDVRTFLARWLGPPAEGGRSFFDGEGPVFVARAPGRLDVMGGIADYSGSTVCEWPIAEAAVVGWQWRADDRLRVRTSATDGDIEREVHHARSDLFDGNEPLSYEKARERLTGDRRQEWAAYVLGSMVVAAREWRVPFERGVNILLDSSVPLGKGVSSSAAVEMATLRALTAALDVSVDGYELAVLGQIVENRVVGAPCGLMDQLTSTFGRAGHLFRIRCQGRAAPSWTPMPADWHVIGIDSGVRHAVTGASYREVRIGAFMGYRIITASLGLRAEPAGKGHVRIDDPLYGGYLTNIPLSVFRTRFLGRLPERMRGADFLTAYGGTTDPVTHVEPERVYPVRAATAHPVEEEHRIRLFIELLEAEARKDRMALLGELMYQSHESYGRCGLGSEATDALVEAVRRVGASHGLYGAKITGGGSGGAVAVLAGGAEGLAAAEAIAAEHGRRYSVQAYVFRGSSPGAMSVDVLRAEPDNR